MQDHALAAQFIDYYEAHKTQIYNYFLYRVRFERETAEDLTSQTFLKAFKAFHRFDDTRSFKTWVFTIAHNLLVNYYRSYKTEYDIAEFDLEDAARVDGELESKLSVEKVMAQLDTLPVEHKELIVLRYINELSYTEIADIVNKEEGTIRVAVSRILKKLKLSFQVES